MGYGEAPRRRIKPTRRIYRRLPLRWDATNRLGKDSAREGWQMEAIGWNLWTRPEEAPEAAVGLCGRVGGRGRGGGEAGRRRRCGVGVDGALAGSTGARYSTA
jgi:hypothetical protein